VRWVTTLNSGAVDEDVDSAVGKHLGVGNEVGDDERDGGAGTEVGQNDAALAPEVDDVVAGGGVAGVALREVLVNLHHSYFQQAKEAS
jgi:hypothetical protein